MKLIYKILLLAAALSLFIPLSACKDTDNDNDENGDGVKMKAKITNIGDFIEVEVLESEYTSGPHWVITSGETEFISPLGIKITREMLSVGNEVEITYSGQVMMSYPPKIVAHSIRVL
jgi:hypothetical protein